MRSSKPRSRASRQAPRAARRRRLPFYLVAMALLGALVLGVVALQAVVSQTSFEMQHLSERNADLARRYGDLQLQVAQLSAPQRIAQEAHRLGLRLPDEVETITVPRSDAKGNGGLSVERPSFAVRGRIGGEP